MATSKPNRRYIRGFGGTADLELYSVIFFAGVQLKDSKSPFVALEFFCQACSAGLGVGYYVSSFATKVS